MEKKIGVDKYEKELESRIENDLEKLVSKKRLEHILSVRKTAKFLADFFAEIGAELSFEDVACAALLHDVTKCMDQKELCERYGITLTEDDKNSPQTLHALTGEMYARDVYRVCEAVAKAVRKHCLGDSRMSLLDKIIFVSDYCEETRENEECKKARKELLDIPRKVSELEEKERLGAAEKELDFLLCDIVGKTIEHLLRSEKTVHTQTIRTLESILKKYKNDESFSLLEKKYSKHISQ